MSDEKLCGSSLSHPMCHLKQLQAPEHAKLVFDTTSILPWRIHVNKDHVMVHQKVVPIFRRQVHDSDAIFGMHFFERLVVSFMSQLPGISIATRKDSSDSSLIELPFVDILGNILSIGAQGVPNIEADVIAVEIEERNVKVDANLRLRIFVNGDAGFNAGSSKCHGLAEKQDSHDQHGSN